MDRREFLISGSGASIVSFLPETDSLLSLPASSTEWRAFEIVTRVEILKPSGATRVWVPTALRRETPYQKTLANDFNAEGGTARLVESKMDGLGIVVAEFPAGAKPAVTCTNRIETKNYTVDFSKSSEEEKPNRAELDHFLRPTKLMPTDGIVNKTATEITADAKTDLEKARAIYEWIVENTFRNPQTRGCGTGDIRFMLETKDW